MKKPKSTMFRVFITHSAMKYQAPYIMVPIDGNPSNPKAQAIATARERSRLSDFGDTYRFNAIQLN